MFEHWHLWDVVQLADTYKGGFSQSCLLNSVYTLDLWGKWCSRGLPPFTLTITTAGFISLKRLRLFTLSGIISQVPESPENDA